MSERRYFRSGLLALTLIALVMVGAVMSLPARGAPGKAKPQANPGLFFVDFRDIRGGADGIALMDLNPDSPTFGAILERTDIGAGVLPHHLYFNQKEERLYTTALGGERLYEVILERAKDGTPSISRVEPIDVGDNYVGEDMYFTENGRRFYVTFMGGDGGPLGGSVGVFDARTNELLETIAAPMAADAAPGDPFLLHPHGISANEKLGRLLVTSAVAPDLVSEPGNTIAEIDLKTNEVVRTHLIGTGPDDPSVPVEVLMLRDGLDPFVLVSTINGGDIWLAPYDEKSGEIGDFVEVVDGPSEGLGVALEFYVHTSHHGKQELYVSFANPGVINVYDLSRLSEMAAAGKLESDRTLWAGPGAHHMAFFETESGRELMVVQNNLLDIPGLNAGSLTVLDPETGEVIRTFDLAADHGIKAEAVESAFGHGADLHH